MVGVREASQSYGRESDAFELSEVVYDSTIVFAYRSSGENPEMDPEARAGT